MARVSRPKEVRIAEIDTKIEDYKKKIESYKAKIQALEEKKEHIENPVPRQRKSMGKLVKKAKEAGMTIDEMAEKLGIEL